MWLGFFTLYVIKGWCETCSLPRELEAFFFWLGYLNSTVNPILYAIFNEEFRKAFKKILGFEKPRPVFVRGGRWKAGKQIYRNLKIGYIMWPSLMSIIFTRYQNNILIIIITRELYCASKCRSKLRGAGHSTSAICMTSILRHVAEAFPPARQGTILNAHRVIRIATIAP